MHPIYFYRNKNGKEPVLEYLQNLSMKSDKDSRIKANKIQARQEQGLTQKQLEELSGVKQPVIARMERGTSTPSVSTIMKLLTPLGKKLAIVPLEG